MSSRLWVAFAVLMFGTATVLYLLGFRWYDHDVIAVGALAIIATALDNRVKAAACDLPWLTDYNYVLTHDVGGLYNELKEFLKRFPEKKEGVARTLGYFDTLSFADRVNRPVFMSLGGNDPIAPPVSVRRLFERIPAVKTLLEIPGMGHERSTLFRHMAQKWFDFFL